MHTTTSTAHSPAHSPSQPTASNGRFRKSMGLPALVLFGLAYMVPWQYSPPTAWSPR